MLQLLNGLFQVSLAVLSLKLLSHGKGDRALVKGLVSGDSHFDLISNSKQQQSSLWLAKCNLSDNLVKALRKQFFSDWTNSTLSGLSFHELLVKHFPQSGNIDSGSWLVAHVLDVVLASFNPHSGAGPSGLRPARLKEALTQNNKDVILRNLLGLVSMLMSGQGHGNVAPWLCSATLVALPKRTGAGGKPSTRFPPEGLVEPRACHSANPMKGSQWCSPGRMFGPGFCRRSN